MIASGLGSSINMLFVTLIVSGILLLLLLLFYYISLAVDSWEVRNGGNEEKKTNFIDSDVSEEGIKEIEEEKIIEGKNKE
ncbi:hypothetical protein [Clostridium butyricum]|uniref:hypothetical protein n=1 Tax=Clostridium butyricum TaxID=1492 RepID=UPI0032C04A3C